MKNIIAYYYGMHIDKIIHRNDKYFFEYSNQEYVFEPYNRPIEDIDSLYKINGEMINNNILVHEIVLNKENKILTYVNNIPYILMEVFINKNAKVTLSEICYINNSSIDIDCSKILDRSDWTTLWETKNDYFESQISEISVKYPILCSYANYYIGLAENAIYYVREVLKTNEMVYKSICHKRINSKGGLYQLYHPMSFICDFRVRDVAEYIKSAFFNEQDAYLLLDEYFKNNMVSYKEALLFYGRLLYPSYFFDTYDDIVNNNLNEKIIESIVLKSCLYEDFLLYVHIYLTNLYNSYIPGVDWIIKRSLPIG